MSIWNRVTLLFRSRKAGAEADSEVLEDSYRKQVELLQRVRRGVADVAMSRKRIELQIAGLAQQGDKLQAQAQAAVDGGNDTSARDILTRKVSLDKMVADLRGQHESLQAEEQKLTMSAERLQSQVENFRTKKDSLSARHAAAEAQSQIQGAFTGVAAEVSEVGQAMQRTEEQARAMEAKSAAIDELVAEGIMEDSSATSHSSAFDSEFDALSSESDVDAQLEELRTHTPRSTGETPSKGDTRG